MAKKPNKTSLLRLNQVSKTYQLGDSTTTVLKDINLEIHEGEFISILGPSGSGKSTLMHICSFLDKPSTGELYFQDKKITSFTEVDLARIRNQTIGFIFQQFNLLNRISAQENVELPLVYSEISAKDRVTKARQMLEQVGLGDRLKNHPNQLSGGQQQRVAIARALVNDPKIIFADEPTGNLDSKSGHEVMEFLKKLNKEGRTVVLVTHEQEVADYAHRQVVIRDGLISADTITLKKKS